MLRALKSLLTESDSIKLEFEANLNLHYMELVCLHKIWLLSTSIGYNPLFILF